MIKMLVTRFTVTAPQILALDTNVRCHDFSDMADWSPKLTMSCTLMHIHSVGYNWRVHRDPWIDHGTVIIIIM